MKLIMFILSQMMKNKLIINNHKFFTYLFQMKFTFLNIKNFSIINILNIL